MTDTLTAISRALGADVQALNTISHNIANLNTPGFRAGRALPDFGATLATKVAFELRDGPLLQTGRPLDLALRGRGFFVLEREGAQVMSRAGAFRIDATGQLVDSDGAAVLGESGPIQSGPDGIRIDPQGRVWAGEREVDRLRIVDVADPSRLAAAANGGFVYEGDFLEWQGRLEVGALERANVDAAEETVRLMALTRHAESVARAISIYDKAMDTGINRLGDNN